MNSPYRTPAPPEEEPKKKRPWLCRIGLHSFGGWADDDCLNVFWCTRCDRFYMSLVQGPNAKSPFNTPTSFFISFREVALDVQRCMGYDVYMRHMLEPPCAQMATHLVRHNSVTSFLCRACVDAFGEDFHVECAVAISNLVDRECDACHRGTRVRVGHSRVRHSYPTEGKVRAVYYACPACGDLWT